MTFAIQSLLKKLDQKFVLWHTTFFGFDIFYFLKTYIASAWCSKKLNIGGTNLTHVNYGIIDNEIKLIDSLKYYQKSLADLSSTLKKKEKKAAEKLTWEFFNQHYYFSTVWPYLTQKLQEKILDIITSGKGIITYELIVDMKSLLLMPDDEQFWNKTEFFSELKLQAVDNESYENYKFLYKTLKMRNLGDLNDLILKTKQISSYAKYLWLQSQKM